MICNKDGISSEEIAAEIQVTGIAIAEFKLCIVCKAKVESHLKIIRTVILKDEPEAPSLSLVQKKSLRIGLAHRMKVRNMKSAERRKLYFK
jgi:hypothetical protein